jgi:hypothetical protein
MLRDVEIREASGFGGDHCLAPSRSVDAPVDGASGRYERLFPKLTALAAEGDALLALGTAGGICDGGESCEDATETAAGWPLFGQFIAHDITADRSPLTHRAELSDAVNFRSPRADLECLYGSGQIGSPFLYRRDDPALLLLGRNDRGEEADVPRNAEGVAGASSSAPSGGRIVAEVLIGVLDADRGSYRANHPGWTPTLPAREERFDVTDLLLATEEERNDQRRRPTD